MEEKIDTIEKLHNRLASILGEAELSFGDVIVVLDMLKTTAMVLMVAEVVAEKQKETT